MCEIFVKTKKKKRRSGGIRVLSGSSCWIWANDLKSPQCNKNYNVTDDIWG